jgi:hypothetical protein
LNVEVTTKSEQLESSAPPTTTDEILMKRMKKLKTKLDSSLEAYDILLEKIEVLCMGNNELTIKLIVVFFYWYLLTYILSIGFYFQLIDMHTRIIVRLDCLV